MRHTVTTCDICQKSYRLQDSVSKKDSENTFTIKDKTYDICFECENKVMRFIEQLKKAERNDFVQDP